MTFNLLFKQQAHANLQKIAQNHSLSSHLKAIHKELAYLKNNPRYPALHTHKYKLVVSDDGRKIFESYAKNHTPAAYRIFWHYGPEKNQITILNIIHHP